MSPAPSDGWTIVESGFDCAAAKAYEGLFTLGSGYLHVRGSLEEHLADEPQNVEYDRRPGNVTSEKFRETAAQWGTYVPGVFARHPTLNNQMVNLPWPLGLAAIVDGERLDMTRSSVTDYRRELSLRDAVLRRRVKWSTRSGVRVAVRFERFVSAATPSLIVQRMVIESDRECSLRIEASIDADVRTNGYWHFPSVITQTPRPGSLRCEVTTDAGDRIDLQTEVWGQSSDNLGVIEFHGGPADVRRCIASAEVPLTVGMSVEIHKRTRVSTSRDQAGIDDESPEACRCAYDRLLAEHAADWSKRWEACDVEIEGDPRSQIAVRTAIYHLLRAHVPNDPRVAIDAKGYAGEAYWGRYFWDTEMYLLPFFLYTRPDSARSLAEFRVHTLDGAKRNARRYGYDGARYAWESDHLGDECCPSWQYADHEVHVTADVAHGLAHYSAAADDPAFLNGPAAQVLVETARYWMQRITFADREALASPRVLGVMGPDEYKPITHDNAYTNRMVAFALERASRHGRSAGVSDDERHAWKLAAERLPILRDADGSLVLQCESFDGLADPEFDRFWLDRERTFAAQVSQERLYRSKCLKQADVLMLMALMPGEFSDTEVRRAWEYYLPYTTHDSSLSAGAHCLIACRLGFDQEAWNFWQRGAFQDLPEVDGGQGGAAEGIHIAGAGAAWQMIVMGFAGFRTALQSEELMLSPRLPAAWSAMSFPLIWKGQPLYVAISQDRTRVQNRSDKPLPVLVHGTRRTIAPRGEEVFE